MHLLQYLLLVFLCPAEFPKYYCDCIYGHKATLKVKEKYHKLFLQAEINSNCDSLIENLRDKKLQGSNFMLDFNEWKFY